jgi:hypothetical protein
MQDNHLQNAVQATMQPFIKLVQANMALLTKFSVPPHSAATANADGPIKMMQQGQESLATAMQSNAMLHLMQGLAKNYTEFMSEFSESSLALLSQGQEAMVKQTRDMSSKVADATQAQGRHVRSATA